MKQAKPYYLVILASTLVLIASLFVFLLISLALNRNVDWPVMLVTALFVFIISFLVFGFFLKKIILDRIKLVYKTIHTRKLTREEKSTKIDLREDVIGKTNQEVIEWAEARKDEISKLKTLEAYRREFLGNVSHELKTPIANIQGYILTLMEGALNDPAVSMSYLEKAQRNVERAIRLVEGLETISLLESGELKLDPAPFNMVTLVAETYELFEDRAKQKSIRLIFHEGFTEQSEVMVLADKERIRQVLFNLIDNSIKYGRPGGRTKVSFYDMDDNILTEVSDNGIGIDAVHLERLFERFYRIDKSRSREIGGSGLGLAIVKHIIESHRQTINVRSTPGVGTTFSFTLKKASL